jgi:hypothetical protein
MNIKKEINPQGQEKNHWLLVITPTTELKRNHEY